MAETIDDQNRRFEKHVELLLDLRGYFQYPQTETAMQIVNVVRGIVHGTIEDAEVMATLRILSVEQRTNLIGALDGTGIDLFLRSLTLQLQREQQVQNVGRMMREWDDPLGSEKDRSAGFRNAIAESSAFVEQPECTDATLTMLRYSSSSRTNGPRGMRDILLRCSGEPATMRYARDMAPLLEEASMGLHQHLRNHSFLPMSSGGSIGNEEALTHADERDIKEYLHYLFYTLQYSARNAIRQRTSAEEIRVREIDEAALGEVLHSVTEALFISFLARRFPAMMHRVEEPVPEAGVDTQEFIHQVERRSKLLKAVVQLVHTLEGASPSFARVPLSEGSNSKRELEYHCAHGLQLLYKSIASFNSLALLGDICSDATLMKKRPELPKGKQMLQPPLMSVDVMEQMNGKVPIFDVKRSENPRSFDGSFRVAVMRFRGNIQQPSLMFYGTIVKHRRTGGETLSASSHLPMSRFRNPEADSAALVGKSLYEIGQAHMGELRGFLGEEQLLERLSEESFAVECVQYVRRIRVRDKKMEWYAYLVFSKPDAERLGILDRVEKLNNEEVKDLQQIGAWCPKEPVMLFLGTDDGRGGGGGGGGSSPPPPEPSGPKGGKALNIPKQQPMVQKEFSTIDVGA
ncbi:MAG: hypothetical protein Q7R81_07665 [Candidatus Peregrinibacteria bacterium]|nr:hypothetical protein [Candidatus Peregrinibacteria bacterium]